MTRLVGDHVRTRMPGTLGSTILLVVALGAAGCARQEATPTAAPETAAQPTPAQAPAHPLAGTSWRLIEFQSMDDATGTVKPADPNAYTMDLAADGTVAMRLNCNRATGTWSIEPSADGVSGQFRFGPLAATRALCPPPSMDERIVTQAEYIRGYILRDGRLYLSLMADGGIFAWEPATEASGAAPADGPIVFETTPNPDLETAILDASPSYTKAMVDVPGGMKGRYVYSRVDLNGDGQAEVLAYMLGSIFCGSGGCNLLLFTPHDGGYRLVTSFPISRTPVTVSSDATHGWKDLWREESGGGARASWVRHTYDGKRYVEAARQPFAQAPAGRPVLAGELEFDKGVVLEPRR